MLICRLASALVAAGYLVTALIATGGQDAGVLLLGVILLPPLALIWFPEVFGSYIGPVGSGRVTRETPPVLIVIAGWFFLVGLPGIFYLISRSRG